MTSLEVVPLHGLPLIRAGDDLVELVASALELNNVTLRAGRLEFREQFRRFLRRQFPSHKLVELSTETDLASRWLGSSVVAASDESFGDKENLLTPDAPAFEPGHYGNRGEIVDGWETRIAAARRGTVVSCH